MSGLVWLICYLHLLECFGLGLRARSVIVVWVEDGAPGARGLGDVLGAVAHLPVDLGQHVLRRVASCGLINGKLAWCSLAGFIHTLY